jgi:putative ATP-dependent endonuclease of OLD family
MYLSLLKLWNFRKYGTTGKDIDPLKPDLELPFESGLNVLIGENDSGKSGIIDAIKLVLKTHSYEWIRVSPDDFHQSTNHFRIEMTFSAFTDEEAKHFTPFLTFRKPVDGGEIIELRLVYDVRRMNDRILPSEVRAGADPEGSALSAEARDYLKTTYLKPLRDAKSELVPRRGSRISQIFAEHEAFKGKEDDHHLMGIFGHFNESVEKYFNGIELKVDGDGNQTETLLPDEGGLALKKEIDRYIRSFFSDSTETQINVTRGNLAAILERLLLSIKDEFNLGLGSLNRLFMASELLHLRKEDYEGLKLGLVEELEAHLHPQAQMQVIETLQREEGIQLILTTHSPNLASKVPLQNVILCTGDNAFPMGEAHTELASEDYQFLERFLDVTKSNLLFAKGVILVEGWSEEILLPLLARALKNQGVIGKDLTQAGVAVVNIGNTAFGRYSRIFMRKQADRPIDIPVALITDCDVPLYGRLPDPANTGKTIKYKYFETDADEVKSFTEAATKEITTKFNQQNIWTFVGQYWTLEFCLLRSCLRQAYIHVMKSFYPEIDQGDTDKNLARKLFNNTAKKSEAPYLLARIIEDGYYEVTTKEHGTVKYPVGIDPKDEALSYLFEAIKYASNA